MPALVGLIEIPVGRQIEYPTAVVVDEVPHGPFDLVLYQLDVALVALVQNPAAEEPERRYEAALAKTIGHVLSSVACRRGSSGGPVEGKPRRGRRSVIGSSRANSRCG